MFSVNFSLFEESISDSKSKDLDVALPIAGKNFHSLTKKLIGFVNFHYEESEHTELRLPQHGRSAKKRSPPAEKLSQINKIKAQKFTHIPRSQPMADQDVLTKSKANPDALINTTESLSTGQKKFECSLCAYSSNTKRNVRRHIEIKHIPSSTVFKCRMCDHTCNLKHNLKRHYMKVHAMPDDAAQAMLG